MRMRVRKALIERNEVMNRPWMPGVFVDPAFVAPMSITARRGWSPAAGAQTAGGHATQAVRSLWRCAATAADKDGAAEKRPARRETWNNLELGWRLQTMRTSPPVTCTQCNGAGRVECRACHATDVLTVGDQLMCSNEGCARCPICDAGFVPCRACKGSGRIAAWLSFDNFSA